MYELSWHSSTSTDSASYYKRTQEGRKHFQTDVFNLSIRMSKGFKVSRTLLLVSIDDAVIRIISQRKYPREFLDIPIEMTIRHLSTYRRSLWQNITCINCHKDLRMFYASFFRIMWAVGRQLLRAFFVSCSVSFLDIAVFPDWMLYSFFLSASPFSSVPLRCYVYNLPTVVWIVSGCACTSSLRPPCPNIHAHCRHHLRAQEQK